MKLLNAFKAFSLLLALAAVPCHAEDDNYEDLVQIIQTRRPSPEMQRVPARIRAMQAALVAGSLDQNERYRLGDILKGIKADLFAMLKSSYPQVRVAAIESLADESFMGIYVSHAEDYEVRRDAFLKAFGSPRQPIEVRTAAALALRNFSFIGSEDPRISFLSGTISPIELGVASIQSLAQSLHPSRPYDVWRFGGWSSSSFMIGLEKKSKFLLNLAESPELDPVLRSEIIASLNSAVAAYEYAIGDLLSRPALELELNAVRSILTYLSRLKTPSAIMVIAQVARGAMASDEPILQEFALSLLVREASAFSQESTVAVVTMLALQNCSSVLGDPLPIATAVDTAAK